MAKKRYKVVDGEYIELTAEEIKEKEERAAAVDLDFSHIRAQRNSLLAACDWTQLSDATFGNHHVWDGEQEKYVETDDPITVDEWKTYRQELRDFPATASKVSELGNFPTAPR
jgi:hypothetical protein